jgi:hypothetical protein
MRNTLKEIWQQLKKEGRETDKGSIHSYLDVYEKELAPYRNTAKNVLEIGIFKGDSLIMWEKYFQMAVVHGIDCDEQPHGGLADLRPMIVDGMHIIHILDAENESEVSRLFDGTKFEVILEDAAHHLDQQLKLYSIFKKFLAPGAIYVIEDCQDIDRDIETYRNIDPQKNVTIMDRREINKRYDDVLVIIRDK